MIGLLAHLQVAGAACVCSHEAAPAHPPSASDRVAGHVHIEPAHLERAHDDETDDDGSPCAEVATTSGALHGANAPVHHHDDGTDRCACAPALPFVAPEALAAPIRQIHRTWTLFHAAPVVHHGMLDAFRPIGVRHARPPPFRCGVSSDSPSSLPVLQI